MKLYRFQSPSGAVFVLMAPNYSVAWNQLQIYLGDAGIKVFAGDTWSNTVLEAGHILVFDLTAKAD